ncbi:hypothetical protein FHR32_005090 [Streptosporangium album]|uniref:Homeodomain-like domain-containing protein n=1 Tax=Streptosporangium album TaxID=47479 RepID=A0A7W7RYQ8_9ACTN|nr:hypothetical protein [Streptosporangium album]MBB4940713.1 hypothetical protein [Streptosporangium album]
MTHSHALMPRPVCEYESVDTDRQQRLRRLAAAYKKRTEAAEAAHDELVAEVLAALDNGEQQVEIVREIGFTREWVRRKVVDARKKAAS